VLSNQEKKLLYNNKDKGIGHSLGSKFSKSTIRTGICSKFHIANGIKYKVKQSRYMPRGPRVFQEVKVPRFHDNGTGWW
jgi:hypothetical protein